MTRTDWNLQTRREPGRTAWNRDAVLAAAFRAADVVEVTSMAEVTSGTWREVCVKLVNGQFVIRQVYP